MSKNKINRRTFMKTGAAAAGGWALTGTDATAAPPNSEEEYLDNLAAQLAGITGDEKDRPIDVLHIGELPVYPGIGDMMSRAPIQTFAEMFLKRLKQYGHSLFMTDKLPSAFAQDGEPSKYASEQGAIARGKLFGTSSASIDQYLQRLAYDKHEISIMLDIASRIGYKVVGTSPGLGELVVADEDDPDTLTEKEKSMLFKNRLALSLEKEKPEAGTTEKLILYTQAAFMDENSPYGVTNKIISEFSGHTYSRVMIIKKGALKMDDTEQQEFGNMLRDHNLPTLDKLTRLELIKVEGCPRYDFVLYLPK